MVQNVFIFLFYHKWEKINYGSPSLQLPTVEIHLKVKYLTEEPRVKLEGEKEGRDFPSMLEFYYFYSNSTNIYLAHTTRKALC